MIHISAYVRKPIDHADGDSVVVLCVCLSDIRRFDSFPRHVVIGFMVLVSEE